MPKPKILIVDDEPDVVTLIERALESEGFQSVAAYDGISALDIAIRRAGCHLLDIMMPMMTAMKSVNNGGTRKRKNIPTSASPRRTLGGCGRCRQGA